MKMLQIHFSSLFLIIAIACFYSISESAPADEISEGEKTILDYYIQLPDRYFQCETENILRKKDKLSLIKKKNLKKGFILASTTDGGIPVEVALFTDDFMGIKVLAVNVRCTAGCVCRRLDFFFVSEGKLLKSEEERGFLFPKIDDIEKAAGVSGGYEFILSEDGKNIRVAEEKSGKLLLNIEWSGGTFNIR